MGLNSFRNIVEGALSTEFNAGNSNGIGTSFAIAYAGEWQAGVATGTYNNNNNGRRKFAARKITDYLQEIRTAEQYKAALAAVPQPPVLGE